ncbi:hypothetical protein [Bacillus pumilus]|uniref:hypothetical protein n=1 Tax=Bacillus pumilus TaxID=1408 RepID=UPI003D712BA7
MGQTNKNILLIIILLLTTFILGQEVVTAAANPVVSAKPHSSGEYIELSWTKPDSSQPYSYRVFSKNKNESQFQSIPTKEKVKVLNVYPDARNIPEAGLESFKNWKGETHKFLKSASVKKWMEEPNSENPKGYGKGLIEVDIVSITDFNKAPMKYLMANNQYKYDVIFAGTWDTNARQDLSDAAEKAIEDFIQTGRGFLAGHDTITEYHNLKNFVKLSKFLNVKTYSFTNNIYKANSTYIQMPWIGSEMITIRKKGLLTSYPWDIGEVGNNLKTPYSHTNSQVALGDVWMSYKNWRSDFSDTTVGVGPEKGDGSGQGTNNVYLTTWNNTAMIQTGHSNGAATPDEQKVLANTLFYLAQVSENTSWNDRKAQDNEAPDKPQIESIKLQQDNLDLMLESKDNAAVYNYYVEATGARSGRYVSKTIAADIESGLKGFAVTVDHIGDTDPGFKVNYKEKNARVSLPNNYLKTGFYLHVRAIDNAGNGSEVEHIRLEPPEIKVKGLQSNQWTQFVDLEVAPVSMNPHSNIVEIEINGEKKEVQNLKKRIEKNGQYKILVKDSLGFITEKTISISNIDKEIPKIDIEMDPKTARSEVYKGRVITAAASGIEDIRIAKGKKSLENMRNEKSISTEGTFEVNDNGLYTFYVKSGSGIENIKTINIEGMIGQLDIVDVPENLSLITILGSNKNMVTVDAAKEDIVIQDTLRNQNDSWVLKARLIEKPIFFSFFVSPIINKNSIDALIRHDEFNENWKVLYQSSPGNPKGFCKIPIEDLNIQLNYPNDTVAENYNFQIDWKLEIVK